MKTLRSKQQTPVGTALLRRAQLPTKDPQVPAITNDITQGVLGTPFQRNATERKLWRERIAQAAEKRVVAVHCRVDGEAPGTVLFIQRSTFLRDSCTGECARLLHTEDMPHPPQYMVVGARGGVRFTLYFEALPYDCTRFDLEEETPDLFPFKMGNIKRNSMDVYHVVLHENKNA